MKGLMRKDLLTLMVYRKQVLFFPVMIFALSFFMNDGASLPPMMLMMYMTIMSMVLYQGDETARWDRYAIALPLPRRTIVGARYLFLLAALPVVMGLAFLLGAGVALAQGLAGWLLPLVSSCGQMSFAYLLLTALMAPVFYKLGPEKGRVATIIVFIVPYVLMIFLMQYIGPWLEEPPAQPTYGLAILAALAGLAAQLISHAVSTRIYARREY